MTSMDDIYFLKSICKEKHTVYTCLLYTSDAADE